MPKLAWRILVLWCLLPAPLAALQDPQQIRVEVEAVNVLVTVVDEKGRFVTGLEPDRFIVYEDGIPQKITNFALGTDLPLMIGLIMDSSNSVRLQLDFEKEAARQFVFTVMRPQDRALLVEFDTGIRILQDFTNRPGAIAQKIDTLRAGGGSALFDAIHLVAREKMTEQNVRKTLVVLSDGIDRNSTHGWEDAVEMSQASDVVIYTIATTRWGASPDKRGEEILVKLAEQTGGRAFFPYSREQLEQAFDLIDQELRSQYSLTYVPPREPRERSYRKIEVRIKDAKNFKIRHKEGYFAPRG